VDDDDWGLVSADGDGWELGYADVD